jgi:hypothetical protein
MILNKYRMARGDKSRDFEGDIGFFCTEKTFVVNHKKEAFPFGKTSTVLLKYC